MLATLVASVCLAQERTLTVFAAASLKEGLTAIAHSYEAANPGLSVKLSFAGSQTLAAQINQGAPADVFASAAEKNLGEIKFDPESRRIFVLNRLEVAVRKGQPSVRSLRDLSNVRNFVVADPAVPVGHYTENFFSKAARVYGSGWLASVRSHIVSREQDVKAVLAKVRLGEGDAGVVYRSDIATAYGEVASLEIPDELNEIVRYPVAIPAGSANAREAKHFIKFLLSTESQGVLEQAGFVSPGHAARTLLIETKTGAITMPLPFARGRKQITVHATDEKGQSQAYKGVEVATLPGVAKGREAVFIAADEYKQTLSIAEMRARKAILMRRDDGNYQLIVPGLKPSVWVNWIRRIIVQ